MGQLPIRQPASLLFTLAAISALVTLAAIVVWAMCGDQLKMFYRVVPVRLLTDGSFVVCAIAPLGSGVFAVTCWREARRLVRAPEARSRFHPIGMLIGAVVLALVGTPEFWLIAELAETEAPGTKPIANVLLEFGLWAFAAVTGGFVAAGIAGLTRWRTHGVEPLE